MEPTSVMESLNAIGGTVGIPAALLVGWLFLKVKGHSEEIERLHKELESVRKENAGELSKIYDKLNLLLADVSYIKGRLFKDEE